MTFGSLGTTTKYLDRYPEFYAGERGDSSGYSYGPTVQWKSKKADKKQAAMSALTLIAFLFFLNILQNCLTEHTQSNPTTTILMTRKNLFRGADQSNADLMMEKEQPEKVTVASRKLLSIAEMTEDNANDNNRKGKFIKNVEGSTTDWKNELTQISDDDLLNQQQKLEQLRQLWSKMKYKDDEKKRFKFKKKTTQLDKEVNDVKKFVNSPVLSDIRVIPKLSHYWSSQRTTITPETKTMLFELPEKRVADFNEFETLDATKSTFTDTDNSLIHDVAQSLQLRSDPIVIAEPVIDSFRSEDTQNTPRYRRSDELPTTLPTELFRPETMQVVTPTESNPQTTKIYQAYTHPSQIFSSSWRTTTTLPLVEREEATEKSHIEEIYFTTVEPPRYFNRHKHYSNHRPHYRPATRYRNSPNRRVAFEPPGIRQEYYPMSVVGQYGGDKESPVIGVLQLAWTLMTSFARPISRIIPQMAKVGSDSQCLDLLACEAQRIGRFMGPTAQSLANTFSTVLSWITPEKQKRIVEEAVIAGREDTCFEQIKSCDERSGGKSTMTMLANLMEFRPKRNSRLPRL